MNINEYIDHTNLKQISTYEDIKKLCEEAIEYNFRSVCISPYYVKYAYELLKNSNVKVCTVIGFPNGYSTLETKVFETKNALSNGADEIDMVINIGYAKEHNYEAVYQDILAVVDAADGTTVKVILETCYLSDEEIVECSKMALKAGADFVKTSTGFGSKGATVEAVSLMKKTVGDSMGVKASGGIHTYDDYLKFVEAGATRIGTSNGVEIMEGNNNNE